MTDPRNLSKEEREHAANHLRTLADAIEESEWCLGEITTEADCRPLGSRVPAGFSVDSGEVEMELYTDEYIISMNAYRDP